MFIYLSKLLPLFIYPAGLACLVLIAALVLRRHPKWQTRLIIAALVVLWLGGNRIVTMAIVRSLEWQYAPSRETYKNIPKADMIVVLGGGSRDLQYPRPMAEISDAGNRLLYAAQLYKHGAAPLILVSGGSVPFVGPEDTSGADAMTDILDLMDIPRDAIIQETRSRNTYENAVESYKILEEKGIDNIILVTSAMHMPRSYAIFSQLDLTVIPAPTDYSFSQTDWEFHLSPRLGTQVINLIPTASNMELLSRAIKEYIGIAIYWLRGWL